jgi:hypothetical protein
MFFLSPMTIDPRRRHGGVVSSRSPSMILRAVEKRLTLDG